MFEGWLSRWVRTDAAVLFVLVLWTMTIAHGSWIWFVGLFLVPDLSMLGYVFGPRVGAAAYRTGDHDHGYQADDHDVRSC